MVAAVSGPGDAPRVIRPAVPAVQADAPADAREVQADGPGWDESAARAFGEWADDNAAIASFGSGTFYTVDDLEAAFAAGWSTRALTVMCPAGCGCRLGTLDADARECGCGGPCCGEEMSRADCGCGWSATGAEVGELSAEVVAHMLTHRPGAGEQR